MGGSTSREQLAAMTYLAEMLDVDHVTVEVIAAMNRAGVPVRLLKGPSFRRWLYADAMRPYVDTDLLVAPELELAAERVLRECGFCPDPPFGLPPTRRAVARNHRWTREHAVVELHVSLTGIAADPPVVWAELSRRSETISVLGSEVEVLGVTARCFHAVLHAAAHGQAAAKPLEDLRRAIEREPLSVWVEAHALAVRLRAEGAFGVGLGLVAGGDELARALGVTAQADVFDLLHAQSVGFAPRGIQRLAETPGIVGKLGLVRAVVFARPALIRDLSPLARRGRLGLVLAYVSWPLVLAIRLPQAFVVWRRARRTALSR